jgi:hypothetical protein
MTWPSAMDALRQICRSLVRANVRARRAAEPREGTKQEQVLAMLRRPEGATVARIAEARLTQHTDAAFFFAGLKKKGHTVEVKSGRRWSARTRPAQRAPSPIYALRSDAPCHRIEHHRERRGSPRSPRILYQQC